MLDAEYELKKSDNSLNILDEDEIMDEDGKRNGLWTYWHENGQKGSEVTYMDREEGVLQINFHLDKECWDEDGNVCECGQYWWFRCI